MTGKEMCEAVAARLNNGFLGYSGGVVTWEMVWRLHPTGELFPVYDLYDLTQAIPDSQDAGKVEGEGSTSTVHQFWRWLVRL